MTDAIRYENGQDNIVVLTMDMPGQSANTMNAVLRMKMNVDRNLPSSVISNRSRTTVKTIGKGHHVSPVLARSPFTSHAGGESR